VLIDATSQRRHTIQIVTTEVFQRTRHEEDIETTTNMYVLTGVLFLIQFVSQNKSTLSKRRKQKNRKRKK